MLFHGEPRNRLRACVVRRGAATLLIFFLSSGVEAQSEATSSPTPTGASKAPGLLINYSDPMQFMRQGGPLMWPILACSVVAFTFGLERLVNLRRQRVIPQAFVRRFFQGIHSGEFDRATAMAFCKMNGSPTAAIFASIIRHWGRPLAEINEAAREAGEREATSLRRNLRALNASANIATLLGLLGTVIGMIDAFNTVAYSRALGRAELLANGIAIALLTTAFGLAVAIPSVLMYNFFAAKVERLAGEIDAAASGLIDIMLSDLRAASVPGPSPIAPNPINSPKTAASMAG